MVKIAWHEATEHKKRRYAGKEKASDELMGSRLKAKEVLFLATKDIGM